MVATIAATLATQVENSSTPGEVLIVWGGAGKLDLTFIGISLGEFLAVMFADSEIAIKRLRLSRCL